jgi:hypothetical protein
MIMAEGTIKRIHVKQHIIKANVSNQTDDHAVTVQWKGKSYIGRDVVIRGASQVKQRMQVPLSCGARIWIETVAEVEIL